MNEISERIEQIRERTEAATEGPWDFSRHRSAYGAALMTKYSFHTEAERNSQFPHLPAPLFTVEAKHNDSDYEPIEPEDAEFVAHSRSDVPYLLSLVEGVGEALASFGEREYHSLHMAVKHFTDKETAERFDALRDAALEADD